MKKKLLLACVVPLVAVAVLIPSLFAPSANAASSEELFYFSDGKIYGINDTTVTSINVPAEIDGVAVTGISSALFARCADLEEITLPDTITYIGTDAFKNTAYYNDATNWENDVLYVGKYLIEGNDSMSGDYTVKANTKLIAESAFDECTGLENVTIPGTVTTIQNYAFEGCTGLESIALSNGVKTIGEKAFNGCSSLKSIELPSSITAVAGTAFAACSNIESITLPDKGINFGGKAFGDTKYYNTAANWDGGLLYAGKHLIGIKASDVGYQFEIKDGTIAFEAYDPTGVFRAVLAKVPKSLKYIDADVFKDYPRGIIVHYSGTEQEWANVTVNSGNDKIKGRVRFTLGGKRTVIASDYVIQNNEATYDGTAKAVTVSKTNNAVGDVTDIKYVDVNGNKLNTAVNAGTYKVLISTAESTDFAAATELELGTLKINERGITTNDVTLGSQLTYTGEELTQTVSVTVDGKVLTEGTDYTVSGNKQTNVGPYTLTVTGKGNYSGTADKEFTVLQASVEDEGVTVEAFEEMTYTGSPQTPKADVKIGTLKAEGTWSAVTNTSDLTTFTATGNFTGKIENKATGMKKAVATQSSENVTYATALRGSSLEEAEVTAGEFFGIGGAKLTGKLEWKDKTEGVLGSTTAAMIFTGDGGNYEPLEIQAEVFTYTSGNTTARYQVKFNTNGGSKIASKTVLKNSRVSEPAEPVLEGFTFGGWYTDSRLRRKYDFDRKVTESFTLYAKWIDNEEEAPDDGAEEDEDKEEVKPWKNPFGDVNENAWYYKYVEYVTEEGLMNGVSEDEFGPDATLTRAMLVTILYRAAGDSAVNKSVPFGDVKADAYYANAVIWAQQNGIVNGVTENEFAPDESITREQIATIIYRYAVYMGLDVTQGGMQVREFADYESIADYALNAITWAVNVGVMNGKTQTTLNPKDNATRAEIAAILQRFLEAFKTE